MVEKRFYIRVREKTIGPFDLDELRLFRIRGQLQESHQLSEDKITWSSALFLPGLFAVEGPPTQAPPAALAMHGKPAGMPTGPPPLPASSVGLPANDAIVVKSAGLASVLNRFRRLPGWMHPPPRAKLMPIASGAALVLGMLAAVLTGR